MLARHQLEIRRVGDHIELRYGEWDARRIVYLDGRPRPRNQPPTQFGHSVGRFDGELLVIETTGIAPNWTRYLAEHSDQLKVTETFARSADGTRLLLTAIMEDSVTLREPVALKTVRGWSPTSEIAPVKDCEIPAGLSQGGK
jgi:hypothetical protein